LNRASFIHLHEVEFSMPSLTTLLKNSKAIRFDPAGPEVLKTVADELRLDFAPAAAIEPGTDGSSGGVIRLSIDPAPPSNGGGRMRIRASEAGDLELSVTDARHLYFLFTILSKDYRNRDSEDFRRGVELETAFPVLRPSFDLFLTQWGRAQSGLDREELIRTLAASGFTHAEVNGLAAPHSSEPGVEGEVYPLFYTYCPALDQFTSSRLNSGAYSEEYLSGNMAAMLENVRLATKYGLAQTLTCFEPRSVPDSLLQRHPMLRGARVDHPLRSFHPRYNLSISHPVVREHYAELVENLLTAAPGIELLSIWSNDSGAGFEYTNSLYGGRNGGGYVIREWKGGKEIAEAAALNILRFMRLLRDSGRRINPRFRTALRLEPFWAEIENLRPGFEDGIDVEVSSMLTSGWRLAYEHPRYREVPEVQLTALHNRFRADEAPHIMDLRSRGADAHVFFAPGTLNNHEPLTGIPFPRLVHEKLMDLHAAGVRNAACLGGLAPPSLAKRDINREVIRAFQAQPDMRLEILLKNRAAEWAGEANASAVISIWNGADSAVRSFPVPIWIYSAWGVWYRMLVRPLVPDIEAIPPEQRRYCEDHMLATAHNRALVDLRYDVGFELSDPTHARWCFDTMNRELFPVIDGALAGAGALVSSAAGEFEAFAIDLRDRLTALRCWFRNQRNAAGWVAGVHGRLEASSEDEKLRCSEMLSEIVTDEIENTRALHRLWNNSNRDWMMISGAGESTFMYSENFGELLEQKIRLMTGRENDIPRIDPDFQWRVPGFTL